ncbi:MAG: hypothetical protein JNM26_09645 [Ideonella sp.]|nr:hypothetical protein [Ideonella sp.]
MTSARPLLSGLLLVFAITGGQAQAQQTPSPGEALRQQYAAMARDPAASALADRRLYLRSSAQGDRLLGEVIAVIDQPYGLVRRTLVDPDAWCGILILHLNVHYCRASGPPGRPVLDTGMGRKTGEPLDELYWLSFHHRVLRNGDDHVAVSLQAPTGPLDTRDYDVRVEAAPHVAGQTLLNLRYGYRHGLTARLAMSTYLATLGAGKVGFSSVGRRDNGQPIRVGGLRGVLERNTMRYHLAIEAYLGALGAPPAQQQRKSLLDWYLATERYPQQLHEIDREAYLDLKLRAIARQETESPPVQRH